MNTIQNGCRCYFFFPLFILHSGFVSRTKLNGSAQFRTGKHTGFIFFASSLCMLYTYRYICEIYNEYAHTHTQTQILRWTMLCVEDDIQYGVYRRAYLYIWTNTTAAYCLFVAVCTAATQTTWNGAFTAVFGRFLLAPFASNAKRSPKKYKTISFFEFVCVYKLYTFSLYSLFVVVLWRFFFFFMRS